MLSSLIFLFAVQSHAFLDFFMRKPKHCTESAEDLTNFHEAKEEAFIAFHCRSAFYLPPYPAPDSLHDIEHSSCELTSISVAIEVSSVCSAV